MNDIILSTQNGKPVASSRQIAESFGKEHKHVLRDIENLIGGESKIGLSSMFFKSEYISAQNKKLPEYLMNRDGFTLLAMGFTGKAALEWKLKYIAAFNEMEKKLSTRAASQLQDLSPELQYLIKLERQQNQQAKQLEQVNERLDFACEAFSLTAGPDWKKACQSAISSVAMKHGGDGDDFESVWDEIYDAMERRGFDLELRVSNAKARALKNGISPSDVRKITKMKIIEAGDKKLIAAFVDSVRELAAKAGTRVDRLDEVCQTSLFAAAAAQKNTTTAGKFVKEV